MKHSQKTALQNVAVGCIAVLHLLLIQNFIFGKVLHPQVGWLLGILTFAHLCIFAALLKNAFGKKQSASSSTTQWWWKVLGWWYAPPLGLIAIAAAEQRRFIAAVSIVLFCAYVVVVVYERFFKSQQRTAELAQQEHVKGDKAIAWGMWIVVVAVIAGAALRTYFIFNGKLDGDEGNYLYDALQILRGNIPYVDYNVRAVSYIGFLAGWLKVVGVHSLAVARASHLVLYAITATSIFVFARSMWGRKVAVAGTVLYALNPFVAFTGMVLKTEPFQEAMHALVLVSCVWVCKNKTYRAIPLLVVAVALDIMTRPSSLIFIVSVAAYLCVQFLIRHRTSRVVARLRALVFQPLMLSVVVVGGIATALTLTAWSSYFQRLFSVLKFAKNMNFAKFADQMDATVRNMVEMLGTVLILELLGLIVLAGMLIVFMHSQLRTRIVLWVAAVLCGSLALYYFLQFVAGEQQSDIMYLVFTVVACVCIVWLIVVAEKMHIYRHIPTRDRMPLLGVVGYAVFLLFFYMLFKRFEVSYVVEFMLPLHILSGYAFALFFQRATTRSAVVVLVTLSTVLSLSVLAGETQNATLIKDNHYRRHPLSAVQQTTQAIRSFVPVGQEIFSGNTVFAADADYRLANDISHPQFDYHDFPSAQKEAKLLTYLIDRNVSYVIEDYKMRYFYYVNNPLITEFVSQNFHTIYYDAQNQIRLLTKNQ